MRIRIGEEGQSRDPHLQLVQPGLHPNLDLGKAVEALCVRTSSGISKERRDSIMFTAPLQFRCAALSCDDVEVTHKIKLIAVTSWTRLKINSSIKNCQNTKYEYIFGWVSSTSNQQ
jgi:hypothetical protein